MNVTSPSASSTTPSSREAALESILGAADPAGAKPAADETGDRFLKLLVAQMRNQDPMNPLDNAQVTSQLAQINTVSGIEKLNASMQKILDRFTSTSSLDAAALVGRRVLTEGSVLELGDKGASAGFQLDGPAQSVRVEIQDAGGQTVHAMSLGATPSGLQRFDWDGRDASGRALPPGKYSFRVAAANGKDAVAATPLSAVDVGAVVRGDEGMAVQLGQLGTRALDAIRGIF